MVKQECSRRACIVVIGDIGRSPRMQYHAQSLLEEKYAVDIVGYTDTKLITELASAENCKVHRLSKFPELNLPGLIKYVLKTIWVALNLLFTLFSIHRPNVLIVQNPPGVPALAVCCIICKLRKVSFIIDWHNYTYSILALTSSSDNFLVRLTRWMEEYFGAKANANFCVTTAMKEDLQTNWGIKATVLYDKPPDRFREISLTEKHDFFIKLSKKYLESVPEIYEKCHENENIESTAFTQKMDDGIVIYKQDRPAILVSSTSWTIDEDFSILLAALEEYEKLEESNYPKLLCVITGKGPQKEYYMEKIAQSKWKKVLITTPWLDAEDYPLILASADLGVSLHYSSSGIDLPMKVVDMFGCGLPVCAKNFKCLNELIQDGSNGFIFETFTQLAEQIRFWFKNFPNNKEVQLLKEKFDQNIRKFNLLRWRDNWRCHAFSVLDSL